LDCTRPAKCRGYCEGHYSRLKKNGDVLAHVPLRRREDGTLTERFLAYIEPQADGCWHWTGTIAPSGYGVLWHGTKQIAAHRFSYEHHLHPIPEGLFVCHQCDVRRCVNPAHLWLGTQSDNMLDASRKGRTQRGTAHPRAFSQEKVDLMRHWYATGWSQGRIAALLGCSTSTVHRIVTGERHRDTYKGAR
jgi:hypothetical protein